MNVGMLWFDNDPRRTFDEKLTRAAEHYRRKYGRAPEVCFVNPEIATPAPNASVGESAARSGAVTVETSKTILPNHFWLGVRE